jgi:hypothetical protein
MEWNWNGIGMELEWNGIGIGIWNLVFSAHGFGFRMSCFDASQAKKKSIPHVLLYRMSFYE